MGRPGPAFLSLPYPLLFHRQKTVEQHNPSEPPGPTLAHTSKPKTINDSENLAIKYRAPAQHHSEDGTSMELVRTDVHDKAQSGVAHTGGASIVKSEEEY